MKRRLFTILSALSLVLCVSMVGLWLVTFTKPAYLLHTKRPVVWGVQSDDGGVTLTYVINKAARKASDPDDGWSCRPFSFSGDSQIRITQSGEWRTLGFVLSHVAFKGGSVDHVARWMAVPHWFLIFLTAVLPLGQARYMMHQRRQTRRLCSGLCLTCGYDLRASPERCPECGTPVAPTPEFRQSGAA